MTGRMIRALLQERIVSADWQSFLKWLAKPEGQPPTEHSNSWEWFSAMARGSTRADVLKMITDSIHFLPDPLRMRAAVGIALLMRELEWSPHSDALRVQFVSALSNVLVELDLQRPATIGSALFITPVERRTITAWTTVLHQVRMMLTLGPRAEHTVQIAGLCNLGLINVLELLRKVVKDLPDKQYLQNPHIENTWVSFQYALTRYTDAARQLNDALGAALFANLTALMPASLKDV